MYPSFHFEQLHQCKVVLTPGMLVPGKVSSLIWYPSLCRTKDKSFKYCQFSILGRSMSNYFEQRPCPSYAILIAFIALSLSLSLSLSFFFVLLSKALHGHACVFSVTCSFFFSCCTWCKHVINQLLNQHNHSHLFIATIIS